MMTSKISFKEDSIYFQYNVIDFDRAKKFYTKIFGFEITFDGGSEVGFRIVSIPEPCSLLILSIGGMVLRRRK